MLHAGAVEAITINTSSLPAATHGFLDLLFNAGGAPFQAATVSVMGFTTNGTLNAASISTSGTVSGTLPSTVAINNDNAEYFEGITFGTGINFLLKFSGPLVDSPSGTGSGSTFTFSLLNATQDGALLTANQNDGYLFTFDINNHGVIQSTTFPTETGAPSVVTISAVPEPGLLLPGALGVAFLAWLRRRRSKMIQ
jgi:hypothetical protein